MMTNENARTPRTPRRPKPSPDPPEEPREPPEPPARRRAHPELYGNVETLLPITEVLRRTGLSRSAIYRGMDNHTFPRNFRVIGRRVRWRASEVDRWVTKAYETALGNDQGKNPGKAGA